MGMVVQHNMNAINAYNNLSGNVAGLQKASEKLASGYRINRSADDAAGLAISEKMRSQIRGLNQSVRNSQDGINMIQTFEGAAIEIHSLLGRMKELAVESANGMYDNTTDRAAIQLEFEQLNDELNQVADTDYNGTIVLNGGIMADGLEAVDGEFNYKEQYDKILQMIEEYANAKDVTAYDGEEAGSILDNSDYNIKSARALWEFLGLDVNEFEDLSITFVKGEDGWKATAAACETNSSVTEESSVTDVTDRIQAGLDKLNSMIKTNDNDKATGKGGFTMVWTDADDNEYDVTAVFGAYFSVDGDYLTLNFKNSAENTYAPDHIGVMEDSLTLTVGGEEAGPIVPEGTITIELTGNLTDELITEKYQRALEALAEAKITYNGNTGFSITGNGSNTVGNLTAGQFGIDDNGDIYISDGKTEIHIASVTIADDIKDKIEGWTDAATDTIEFQLNIDEYNVADYKDVKANSIETPQWLHESLKPHMDAFGSDGVSTSNAFKNAVGRMTYVEHIALQIGARTKDIVDFAFGYDINGATDTGDLPANLNLSGRKEGLNTANLCLANQEDANYAIDQIDKAINKTSMVRATFGAIQNRLDHKISNLTIATENLTEAESAIRDTDMAQEMMNFTKYNILNQAAQSMLSQANQQPQSILQLLG